MDQFQIRFWKSRQAEWEPYTFQYAPLRIEQGKLTDPLYFDFISYVQFQTAAREIPNSVSVFEERSGAEGTSKVIRRDPSLSDNKILPAVLAQRLGDTIYARLRYGFEDEDFVGMPEPCPRSSGDIDCVAAGMKSIVDVFVSNGYALRGEVITSVVGGGDGRGGGGGDDGGGGDVDGGETGSMSSGGGGGGGGGRGGGGARKVIVRLAGPATLWGAQALAARGVNPPNEYVGYCMTAFCRASGVKSSYTSKVSDTGVDMEFNISRV